MDIKKEDIDALEQEESTIDTVIQSGLFREYFPEVSAKMLEAMEGVYQTIQDAKSQ